MSHAEIVKNRIIDIVPYRRPEPDPEPQALSTFAWTTPPVSVVEEVQLWGEPDPRLVVLHDPDSPQARAYRLLRNRLTAQGDPRVITVTSPARGDGKTTCAANLALVLSEEALSRVLLVETNLMWPGVANLFRFEPADSFMTKLLLTEEASPPYAVASISRVRLQLAAVHPQIAYGKHIDRTLLADAVHDLKNSYDYIVFDAAAVSDSADPSSVAACSEAAVLVARAGRTRQTDLQRAAQQLSPARIAGVVVVDT